MNEDRELLLLLGRLEGKVDTIITGQSAHGSRLDRLEARQAEHDVWRAGIDAKVSSNKGWWSMLLTIGALALSAFSTLKGFIL